MIRQPDSPVILASASPRRKVLLEQLGLTFEIIPAHIDEAMLPGETPLKHVLRLSEEKGKAVAEKHPDSIIISSDTIVVHDNKILGKPKDKEDADRMLRRLSGQTHEVISAFSICCAGKGLCVTKHEVTEVHFRELTDEDIYAYIAGGSPMDKAGAYGIQDVDAYLVNRINGSYHNVMGFPVAHFATIWNEIIK